MIKTTFRSLCLVLILGSFSSAAFGIGNTCALQINTTQFTSFPQYFGNAIPLAQSLADTFLSMSIWQPGFDGGGTTVYAGNSYRAYGADASYVAIAYQRNDCQSDFVADSSVAFVGQRVVGSGGVIRGYAVLEDPGRTWNNVVYLSRGITFSRVALDSN